MERAPAGVTRENLTISRLGEGDDFKLTLTLYFDSNFFWDICILDQSFGTPGSDDGDSDVDADLAEELMLGMETGVP